MIAGNTVISYVAWNNFYSVGDPTLDWQHKQIVDIINELYEAMQNDSDRVVVKSILDSLLKYTLSHFKYEEQVLKDHKYPDLMSHVALHGKIRQKTRELQEQADLVKGHGMLHFLAEWWVGHIRHLHKKYMPYLELPATHR